MQWIDDRGIGHAGHPDYLLRNAVGKQIEESGKDFVETMSKQTFPFQLEYSDATAADFENVLDILWNGIMHEAIVIPRRWGRLVKKN
jgi:hypothetical protein